MNTDHLAPVSLDELVANAALMSRTDRKYLVPTRIASGLIESLDATTRVLEIAGRRGFRYDSVYFDTDDHLSYRLTAQRRRRRFKIRSRTYLDTGGAYLEMKTKNGRGATIKERIPYDPADRARLTNAGRTYAAGMLCDQGHDRSLADRLRASLISRYRRTTLLLPDGGRATIDTDLAWVCARAERDERRPIMLQDHVIVETKSLGRAGELDRLLWSAGRRPSGISKFGTGTAALHPELPGNKWARVLRGPFRSETAAQADPQPTPQSIPPSWGESTSHPTPTSHLRSTS